MQGVRPQGKVRVRRARGVVALAIGVATWAAVGLPVSGAAESSGEGGRSDRQAVEAMVSSDDAGAGDQAGERLLVVADRDTLWDLAREHAPDGMDRREWAAEVADRNGIDPREIRPGDALRVPAELLSGAVSGGS